MGRQKMKDGGSIDGRADNNEKKKWLNPTVGDIISLKVGMKDKKIYQSKVY